MGFAETKRSIYTQVKIQKMRSERKTKKAKVSGVPDSAYIRSMGDLIGAGHLKFNTLGNLNISVSDTTVPDVRQIKKTIRIVKHKVDIVGEAPDMVGYLASGHPKDPGFALKGWINEDGSIRLELVTAYGNL